MAKQKQPTKKICANVPALWMDMLDERAVRECISRTQAIKYAIRAYCFQKSKGTTIDNRPQAEVQLNSN